MTWSETFFVMIMTHDKWKTFTDRPIPPRGSSEIMLGLACESRDEVDERAVRAGAAGGTLDAQPVADHGFMYSRTITDPDDHLWEVMWMAPATAHGQITSEADA
jgi:predicted lactoylglutathione lyase